MGFGRLMSAFSLLPIWQRFWILLRCGKYKIKGKTVFRFLRDDDPDFSSRAFWSFGYSNEVTRG